MSELQVTNYGICGECKWHKTDEELKGWLCTNENGDYCGCYTAYTDTCECFEQRGVE